MKKINKKIKKALRNAKHIFLNTTSNIQAENSGRRQQQRYSKQQRPKLRVIRKTMNKAKYGVNRLFTILFLIMRFE